MSFRFEDCHYREKKDLEELVENAMLYAQQMAKRGEWIKSIYLELDTSDSYTDHYVVNTELEDNV